MDNEYPAHYVCPITMDLMTEPILASDGNVYDKKAIFDWYDLNQTSPLTRETLDPNFVLLEDLQEEIHSFMKKHNIKVFDYRTNRDPTLRKINCSRCDNNVVIHLDQTINECNMCNVRYLVIGCNSCKEKHIVRYKKKGIFKCINCNHINNFNVNTTRSDNNCTIQ